MNPGNPFHVEKGLTQEEDAEAIDLIGWCWGAPETVRLIIGKKVYMDMSDRTVRRLSAFMVN
jgi:hypothetical protein